MFRNFKLVPNVIFGRGCFAQLDEIVEKQRDNKDSWVVFVMDDVFKGKDLKKNYLCMKKICCCGLMWMMNQKQNMWMN